MNNKPITFASLLILFAVIASPALAAKANVGTAGLRRTATHVIVGTVLRIYAYPQTTKDRKIMDYVAEIRIKDIEKGEGLKNGDLVYARYWSSGWLQGATPVPSDSGHRGIPREGETLRVYLARNACDGYGRNQDGGFNVIGPDGFERLKPKGKL